MSILVTDKFNSDKVILFVSASMVADIVNSIKALKAEHFGSLQTNVYDNLMLRKNLIKLCMTPYIEHILNGKMKFEYHNFVSLLRESINDALHNARGRHNMSDDQFVDFVISHFSEKTADTMMGHFDVIAFSSMSDVRPNNYNVKPVNGDIIDSPQTQYRLHDTMKKSKRIIADSSHPKALRAPLLG